MRNTKTMNNILNKIDLCAHYPQLVAMKNKSRLIPVIITLVGIMVLALANSLSEAEDLSIGLYTIGLVVLIIGIVKLIRPSREIIYLKTGERISRRFDGYKQEDKEMVLTHLQAGDFDALAKRVFQGVNAPFVTVTYTTESGSLRVGQMMHYVPYEYEPLSEVYIHTNR